MPTQNSDPSGLSSFLSNWTEGCQSAECQANLETIETYINGLAAKILSPIVDKLGQILPVKPILTEKIKSDLEIRIADLEVRYQFLVTGIQDKIMAALAPVYTTVNGLIAQSNPYGYQAVGPLSLQPLINLQQQLNQQENIVVNQQNQAINVVNPSPNVPPGSIRDKAANQYGQQPIAGGYQSGLPDVLQRGGIPVDTIPTPFLPLWILTPTGSNPCAFGHAVQMETRPQVDGQDTFGPFMSGQALIDFCGTSNPYGQQPIAGGYSSGNLPPTVVTVPVAVPGPAVVAQTGPPVNVNVAPFAPSTVTTERLVSQQFNVRDNEYIAWLQTDEGRLAIKNAYLTVGIDVDNLPPSTTPLQESDLLLGMGAFPARG